MIRFATAAAACLVATASMLCAAAPPLAALTPKIPRIGLLSPADPTVTWFVDGFREGLKELGYIEDRNIRIDYRWAHGRFDRLPALAAELVGLDVDVIVASVSQASLAAQAATRKIPIVMVGVADPIGIGLVASLARPGGNITGTSAMTADLVGKQLELLKEMVPEISRVAVLWNPANTAFQRLQVREAEAAGRRAGVQLQFLEASTPGELDAAFSAMRRDGERALLLLPDPLWPMHRRSVVERVANDRIVAVTGHREIVDAGGLMAYSPSYFHASKRAAAYVDKILKGARPADLPIEQSTRFELILNLKSAKALGLDIPPSILARADEVIE